eukprot:365122-Chlamydomonas_euryale.AAC.35
MVHPDKCKHPQASTAFDSESAGRHMFAGYLRYHDITWNTCGILGEAQKQLFNEELRNFINMVLDTARGAPPPVTVWTV